jgi:transposase
VTRPIQSAIDHRNNDVRPREQYEALKAARERQSTSALRVEQPRRAGIEGILAYGIRACGLRRSRSIGLARTHVQHVLTAAAMNLVRVARWLADKPCVRMRRSPLLRLQQAASVDWERNSPLVSKAAKNQ